MMRRSGRVPGAVVMVGLVLAGCSGSSDPAPSDGGLPASSEPTAWREPGTYSYTLDSSCGERDLIGRFRIEVENGAVHKVEGLDEPAMRYTESRSSDINMVGGIPTLANLLAGAEAAQQDGADVVDITTDPDDGHPVAIEIDWSVATTDDEACYVIGDFVPSE